MARLFVHCATSVEYLAELHAAVPGVKCYPERALLLAGPDDLVCIADEVDSDYLEYLRELGLGTAPANLVVASRYADLAPGTPLWKLFLENEEALDALCHAVRARGTSALHPFMATQGQFDLAAALSGKLGRELRVLGADPELVAYADCKHHIRAAALELGVPVAPGEIVELHPTDTARHHRILRAAITRQSAATGRVMVRGSSGAAGSATFITSARRPEIDDLVAKLIARRDNRFYLVESMVEVTASPNIQMQINEQDGSVECVGVSDQRLSPKLVYRGNVCPSAASRLSDMLRWSEILARWLRDAGYAGLAGFDFVEFSNDHGAPRAFLTELNPRVNGATYPVAVLQRLGSAAFASGMINTGVESFAELRQMLPELLYTPERGTGLLPYATGCLKYGRCGMMALAGSRAAALELYSHAERTLGELYVVRW